MRALGVDIGGSGIKAAVVDCATGELVGERVRLDTPRPGTPEAVIAATREAMAEFPADLPVGVGFPGPVVRGTIMAATHMDDAWIGLDAEAAFAAGLGRSCTVLNDADAAGLAEVEFGAGAGRPGVVVVLTLGTGIGSAVFLDGQLVPNTEFGHIEIDGMAGERRAAASRRTAEDLSWEAWAARLETYLSRLDRLIWPDLIILGGGVSRKQQKFLHLLSVRPTLMVAELRNRAGIIGAATRAATRRG